MLLTMESAPGGSAATRATAHVAVFEVDRGLSAEVVALLEAHGYRVSRLAPSAESIAGLRGAPPSVAIWAGLPDEVGGETWAALRSSVRELGIPMLDVVDPRGEARMLPERHAEADDWVWRSRAADELAARVEFLRRRRGRGGELPRAASADSRFFPLIVHDLRTPLNVISLSLRMVDQALPRGNPELEEDLRFVEDNVKQIERMLAQLSDYYRLFESDVQPQVSEFSPERLLSEVIEAQSLKGGARRAPVTLEVGPTSPPEASLDPFRARQAIQYALANSLAASNGEGVRVALHGGPARWVTEFVVDQPAPPSVKSTELRPQQFERLCGTAAERRGMDLAITAKVSELFGGSARLEVVENRGSRLILDWPARMAPPST